VKTTNLEVAKETDESFANDSSSSVNEISASNRTISEAVKEISTSQNKESSVSH
jgi:hypothetical protein